MDYKQFFGSNLFNKTIFFCLYKYLVISKHSVFQSVNSYALF